MKRETRFNGVMVGKTVTFFTVAKASECGIKVAHTATASWFSDLSLPKNKQGGLRNDIFRVVSIPLASLVQVYWSG